MVYRTLSQQLFPRLQKVLHSENLLVLFIGDGMSFPQFQSAADYLGALADSSAMAYELDRTEQLWSLADYVEKGIQVLDNDKGFFL